MRIQTQQAGSVTEYRVFDISRLKAEELRAEVEKDLYERGIFDDRKGLVARLESILSELNRLNPIHEQIQLTVKQTQTTEEKSEEKFSSVVALPDDKLDKKAIIDGITDFYNSIPQCAERSLSVLSSLINLKGMDVKEGIKIQPAKSKSELKSEPKITVTFDDRTDELQTLTYILGERQTFIRDAYNDAIRDINLFCREEMACYRAEILEKELDAVIEKYKKLPIEEYLFQRPSDVFSKLRSFSEIYPRVYAYYCQLGRDIIKKFRDELSKALVETKEDERTKHLLVYKSALSSLPYNMRGPLTVEFFIKKEEQEHEKQLSEAIASTVVSPREGQSCQLLSQSVSLFAAGRPSESTASAASTTQSQSVTD